MCHSAGGGYRLGRLFTEKPPQTSYMSICLAVGPYGWSQRAESGGDPSTARWGGNTSSALRCCQIRAAHSARCDSINGLPFPALQLFLPGILNRLIGQCFRERAGLSISAKNTKLENEKSLWLNSRADNALESCTKGGKRQMVNIYSLFCLLKKATLGDRGSDELSSFQAPRTGECEQLTLEIKIINR